MARWRCRPSLLPSFIMPCPCGGRMKMVLGEPAIQADGTENLSYRCSICRIELAATRAPYGPTVAVIALED